MAIRVMIVGTGGVGGYFGARLAVGGCDVKFVARGRTLAALRENGLQVESELGDLHLTDINVSDNPSDLGGADIVLICVKLWDTEEAVRAVGPVVGPDTAVISLQNGVRKDDVLRGVIDDRSIVGGMCQISASILRPGVIRHKGTMQRIVFGEYDGSVSSRLKALPQDACLQSGIDADISSDIKRTIWEKFVFLVGVSAATTVMRKTIGPIRDNTKTRSFVWDLMCEAVAVARAHGVGVDKNFADDRLVFVDSLPVDTTSSMHHDLEQGNRLEVDWLSGEVVRLGAVVGIPTPLNRAVSDILELYKQGSDER